MTEKEKKDIQSPGQALQYFLKKKDWTQEDLSYILSISLKHTNEIVKDKKPISLEIAKLLANIFDLEASDWMNLSTKYQLKNSPDFDKEKSVLMKAEIYKYMPVNELIKKGWISGSDDLNKEIKSFWRIPKGKELDLSFLDTDKKQLEYKRAEIFEDSFNEYNALIWHQMALNFAESMKIKPYNRKGLLLLLGKMHTYTTVEDGVKKFLNELSLVGVKFVFLSHLSKTYLDGAAFLSTDGPIVALTGRYDRIDNFWFTLAHELSHVAFHLTNGESNTIFIDDTTKKATATKELEANNKAEEVLLQEEILQYFAENTNYITEDKVREFSRDQKIHASIVVGILAHNALVSYATLQRFKEPVREQIPAKYKAEPEFLL